MIVIGEEINKKEITCHLQALINFRHFIQINDKTKTDIKEMNNDDNKFP